MLDRDGAIEFQTLEAFDRTDDGGYVTWRPEANGRPQLGGRVPRGLHFVPDRRGGGRLYATNLPGAKLIARVKRGTP
jgi:hypothetical protein